jgi:hypothetical protein
VIKIEPKTLQLVLETIKDLHAQEQIVDRDMLPTLTGLTLGVIDRCISLLIEEGMIQRVQRGIFVPVQPQRPNRPMSKTIIPDGWVKIEIGDDYAISLSPSESRALGELTAGAGQQFAAIELGHQAAIMASMLNQRMLRLERLASPLENSLALVARIKALEEEVKRLSQRKAFKEPKPRPAKPELVGA